jgi:HSP20 family protein
MDSLQRRTDRGQDNSLMRRDTDLDLFSPSAFFSASPWQMMRRMQEDMDRVFGSFLGGASNRGVGGMGGAMTAFAPNVDLSEDEKEFCLEMDLPGFRPEDVDIQVRNGQLWLRAETRQESEQRPQEQNEDASNAGQSQGQQRQYHRRERRYGVVQQGFTLPDNVDEANIRAEFNQGVLMLHLPKHENAMQQGRRIPIGGTASTQQPQIGAGNAPGSTGGNSGATGAGAAGGAGTEAGSRGWGGSEARSSEQATPQNTPEQKDQTRQGSATTPSG